MIKFYSYIFCLFNNSTLNSKTLRSHQFPPTCKDKEPSLALIIVSEGSLRLIRL